LAGQEGNKILWQARVWTLVSPPLVFLCEACIRVSVGPDGSQQLLPYAPVFIIYAFLLGLLPDSITITPFVNQPGGQ
jgi:hypothetical protein